jgi:hypothetical protein
MGTDDLEGRDKLQATVTVRDIWNRLRLFSESLERVVLLGLRRCLGWTVCEISLRGLALQAGHEVGVLVKSTVGGPQVPLPYERQGTPCPWSVWPVVRWPSHMMAGDVMTRNHNMNSVSSRGISPPLYEFRDPTLLAPVVICSI